MDMPLTNQDVLTQKEGLAGRLRLNRPEHCIASIARWFATWPMR